MERRVPGSFSVEAHNRSRSARAAIREQLESGYDQPVPEVATESYRRPEDQAAPTTDMERLLERLQDHEVGYHLVAGKDELLDLMANQLYARGGLKTVVDDRALVARFDIVAGLRRRLLDSVVEPAGGPLAAADAELGITPCCALIAETGTMVLAGNERPGLEASLLPARHFVIAAEEQVVATLDQWLATRPAAARQHVLVSGPSRTADIEKQVVVGVHGPWKVSVFILRKGWERE